MSQELVSVIMPTYNTGRFLSKSIESVLNQTYQNLELLITDDGSTDETLTILEDYAQKDPRVKVFCLGKHQGPGHARNNSIQEAKADILPILTLTTYGSRKSWKDSLPLWKKMYSSRED